MESRVPLPTDNVYKFYALFGLFLFVFSVGAMIYTTKSANTFITDAAVELETLKALQAPDAGQAARKSVLARLIDVEIANKNFFKYSISTVAAIGFWMMIYGFYVWHRKIQPLQDAMARLQLRKLELEVERMERESGKTADEKASSRG